MSDPNPAIAADLLFDAAPCGIFSFDPGGRLLAANRTLAHYLGVNGEEVLTGRHVESLLTLPSRIFYQTHFFPLLQLHGEAGEIFLTLAGADGEAFPVVCNARRIVTEAGERYICVVVPVHRRQQLEQELIAARREAEAALRTNTELDQLRSRLESNQTQLDRRMAHLEQRNEELDQLNRLLAHDLQEPLRKIQLFANLLTRQHSMRGLSAETLEQLQKVVDNAVAVSDLINDVQRYIGLDTGEVNAGGIVPVELSSVIDRAARRLRTEYGRRDWVLHTRLDVPPVEGWPHQLELLFYHLLDNAIKFSSPEKLLRVQIEAVVVEHNRMHALPDAYQYSDFVRLVVCDNGPGFEQSSLSEDWLFRLLKKEDRSTPGSGIGLPLCKKIVRNHYGSISANNAPGGGAQVTVWLPLSQKN